MFGNDSIRSLLVKRPFIPFRVVLSSGKVYEVRHPEMVMTGAQAYAGIGLPIPEDPLVFAETTWVAYIHIAEILQAAVTIPEISR